MSALLIRNRSVYPDGEVRQLIRFAMSELDLPSRRAVLVYVGHTRPNGDTDGYVTGHAFSGRGFIDGTPRDLARAGWEIHLRMPKPDVFPIEWHDRGYKGVGPMGELADWREALVAIAAHEGRHVESYQQHTRRARTGREEEARCDAHALWMVRRYRQKRDQAAIGATA